MIRIIIRSPRYEKWDARSRISSFHAASWGFCRLQLLSEHEQYRGVAGFMLAHGGAPISSTSGRQPFTLLLAPQKLNWLDMLKLKNQQRALINYYKSLVVTLAATSTEIVFLPGSWLPVTAEHGKLAISGWDAKLREVLRLSRKLRDGRKTPVRAELRHVPGPHRVAEGLTKPLQGQGFRQFINKLNLVEASMNEKEDPKVLKA